MPKRSLASLAIVLVAATGAHALETTQSQGPGKPEAAAPLVLALKKLDTSKGFLLSGKVSRSAPEGRGMGGMQVMMGAPGQGGEPFSGAIEVYRPRRGETILVSRPELPGIVIYELDKQRITRTTIEDTPIATSELGSDLHGLLEIRKVIRAVEKARLRKVVDEEKGTITYEGSISKRLARSTATGLAVFQARVLKILGRWTLDANGSLIGMRYEVRRSDPTASLMQKALAGGGGGVFSLEDLEDSEEEETEGVRTVYRFEVKKGRASKRTREALASLRKLIDD
ncbi:MAG: hypothetical protein ACE5F1_07540 [Planctomycetota bacterium]